MLATTEVKVQDIQMLGLHLEWEIEIHIQRYANRTEDQAFLCRKRTQASRFGTKMRLAGRTLTPMPPPGGKLTVELRIAHRRSYLFRGVGRVVPTCAVLQTDRASVQVYAT